jgi:hypothetical protein
MSIMVEETKISFFSMDRFERILHQFEKKASWRQVAFSDGPN